MHWKNSAASLSFQHPPCTLPGIGIAGSRWDGENTMRFVDDNKIFVLKNYFQGLVPTLHLQRWRNPTMTQTGLPTFDNTVQTTNIWLNDLMLELGKDDRHLAYAAMRSVLHALRDRLTVEHASALGAQLPMLVRGFYYEGYKPHGKPTRERRKDQFLAKIRREMRRGPTLNAGDSELMARAVLHTVKRHLGDGTMERLAKTLPKDLRELI